MDKLNCSPSLHSYFQKTVFLKLVHCEDSTPQPAIDLKLSSYFGFQPFGEQTLNSCLMKELMAHQPDQKPNMKDPPEDKVTYSYKSFQFKTDSLVCVSKGFGWPFLGAEGLRFVLPPPHTYPFNFPVPSPIQILSEHYTLTHCLYLITHSCRYGNVFEYPAELFNNVSLIRS